MARGEARACVASLGAARSIVVVVAVAAGSDTTGLWSGTYEGCRVQEPVGCALPEAALVEEHGGLMVGGSRVEQARTIRHLAYGRDRWVRLVQARTAAAERVLELVDMQGSHFAEVQQERRDNLGAGGIGREVAAKALAVAACRAVANIVGWARVHTMMPG